MKTRYFTVREASCLARFTILFTIGFILVLCLGTAGWAINFSGAKGVGQVRGSGSLTGVKTDPKLLPHPTISRYSKSAVHVGEELYVYGKFLSSSSNGLRAYLHNNRSSWNIRIANWSQRGTGFNTRIPRVDAGTYEVNIISNGKLVAHGPMTLRVLPGSR